MAPLRRYTDGDIIRALKSATSLKEASDISGMSMGAMSKRCRPNSAPYHAWLQCRQRGIANQGRHRSRQ